jgi:hypothetical protein
VLEQNEQAIHAKVEQCLAQLTRGEGIPGNQLRARLAQRRLAHWRTTLVHEPFRVVPKLP